MLQRTGGLALMHWQAREKSQRRTGESSSWTYSCSSRGTSVPICPWHIWTGALTQTALRVCSSDAQDAWHGLEGQSNFTLETKHAFSSSYWDQRDFWELQQKQDQARIISQAKCFHASNNNWIRRAENAVCARLAHVIAVSYTKLGDPSSGLPREHAWYNVQK